MEYDAELISIWPNPTDGVMEVMLKSPEDLRVFSARVLDLQGKLCLDREGIQRLTLDFTGMPQGVYSLEIPELSMTYRVIHARN
jgi:hypothetical protein